MQNRKTGGSKHTKGKHTKSKRRGGNSALRRLALPMSLYATSLLTNKHSLRDYQRTKKRRHPKKHKKSRRSRK